MQITVLLLCANHDALFDRHLISFNPDTGNICISESIDNEQRKALSISESTQLSMGECMKSYMRIHYKKFIDKENHSFIIARCDHIHLAILICL